MIPVRLIWTPHPHQCAFSIIDDPEGSTAESVRLVYDTLSDLGLRSTKGVWVFESQKTQRRSRKREGVTLQDRPHREYCAELTRRGFEIALHGASSGNDLRERSHAAFEFVERELGRAPIVCASDPWNVECMYGNAELVARGPLRWALAPLRLGRRSLGEDPTGLRFWGDVCRERIRYMRLFRTPSINTLVANPSMPYFEREKPLVRSWFTVTEHGLAGVTTPESLATLAHENGACLLRQHLVRHVDLDRRRVSEACGRALRRLRGAPNLWVDTAGAVLDRLRLIQGVILAYRDANLWLVNTNDEPVTRLQLVMGDRPRPQASGVLLEYHDGVAVVTHVPPRSITYLDCSAPLVIEDRNAVALDAELHGTWRFGHGTCWLNLGHAPWSVAERMIAPLGYALGFESGHEDLHPMSQASDAELTSLFLGHVFRARTNNARLGRFTPIDGDHAGRHRTEMVPP